MAGRNNGCTGDNGGRGGGIMGPCTITGTQTGVGGGSNVKHNVTSCCERTS